MKKFSKICINSSIFISSNMLMLMLYVEKSNATPISKPSTVRLLSEVIRSPHSAFIRKLSNGNLKGNFLHSGQNTTALHVFSVKAGALVDVKKTHDGNFYPLSTSKHQRRLEGEGVNFRIYTYSKSGLKKKINIFMENGNLIVNSIKGIGTPDYILKRTVLEFGDGASTSSQSSSSSSTPKITVTRYSSFNETSNSFNVEKISTHDPSALKLISKSTKNKLTGQTKSVITHENDTKTKIVENSDGSSTSSLLTSNNELLFSKTKHGNGNTTITKKLESNTYLIQKYNQNLLIEEETLTTPNSIETKKYNENGSLTSTTSTYRLPDGSSLGTTTSSSSTTTYERRNDGSLISITSTTPNGEILKQDFDVNNAPLNNPYRIN